MLDADPTCRIELWFDKDAIKDYELKSFNVIPESLFKFNKYFSRARPNAEGGRCTHMS